MRRSLSKMLVEGSGLPGCYLLSVVVLLKMSSMGQKDDLVSELAPLYTICCPPNLRITDCHVIIIFSLLGEVTNLVLLANLWEQKCFKKYSERLGNL